MSYTVVKLRNNVGIYKANSITLATRPSAQTRKVELAHIDDSHTGRQPVWKLGND